MSKKQKPPSTLAGHLQQGEMQHTGMPVVTRQQQADQPQGGFNAGMQQRFQAMQQQHQARRQQAQPQQRMQPQGRGPKRSRPAQIAQGATGAAKQAQNPAPFSSDGPKGRQPQQPQPMQHQGGSKFQQPQQPQQQQPTGNNCPCPPQGGDAGNAGQMGARAGRFI